MRAQSKAKRIITAIVYHCFVILLGFVMLYPILWLAMSSFKPSDEVFRNASSLIPEHFTLQNYVEGWKGFGDLTFSTFFRNSIVYAIVATIGQVVSSTIVAYGFARVKFRGRKGLFAVLIMTMLIPSQVLMIPQYLLFYNFGWINSYKPLLIPAFTGLPFFIFLIMQFIRGIPKSIDESALMDGCGHVRIFSYMILPLSVPSIITSAVFAFYWRWDDLMGPLLYLQKPKLYTVSLALRSFSDPVAGTDWGVMFAMLMLSLIPCFLVFIFFQKYLVEGIVTTGMKS